MGHNKNLPEEVIEQEILIRLPFKLLIRCRCVCKSWNSLSYNPNFVSHFNNYLSSVSQNPNSKIDDDDDDDDDYVICMNDYDVLKDSTSHRYGLSILSRNNFSETRVDNNFVFPSPLIFDCAHLIGCINGLVCMTFYECAYQLILWNPIIRFLKHIIVPEHLGLNHPGLFLYGFGWDSVTNDYKLIIAKTSGSVSSPSAAVYSCKTDCWSNALFNTTITVSLYEHRKPPCVIVSGCPYWSTYLFDMNTDIVKFDITNNEFTCLRLPSGVYNCSLINISDCLALIEFKLKDYDAYIYRFDEQRSIWTKMYAIDESVILHVRPLCFKYGGEIVFDRKKQLYDPKSHSVKRRHCGSSACLAKSRVNKIKCPDCQGFGSLVNGYSYTPSLVVLPGMKALMQRSSSKITCCLINNEPIYLFGW